MSKKHRNKKPILKATMAPTKIKQQQRGKTKNEIAIPKYRRVPQMNIGLISLLITLLAFLFLVYPRIYLSPGDSLNTRNPFKTPFILKNDGYLNIYNIDYTLSMEYIEDISANQFAGSMSPIKKTISKLNPNLSSVIFIDNLMSVPDGYIKEARILINVTYRPSFVPFTFTKSFRFKTEIKNTGEYVWFESYYKQ
jgi:hypothetical protein